MKQIKLLIVILCLCCSTSSMMYGQQPVRYNDSVPVPGQWSKERINKWYEKQPWLVGCNYIPATAINQIEMWQASTWDPETIDKELGWASAIGMNTLRVYLHDLVWASDEAGLYKRMDEFLDICHKYGTRPWFVFFDDCHFPNPQLGEQPLPIQKYHNSGWLNCPARKLAVRYARGKETPEEAARLKGYVQNTMRHFRKDKRILMWELYNEPGRGKGDEGDMTGTTPEGKIGNLSARLVYDSWLWAREINPSQPITSCTAGSVGKINVRINRINSDLHSIHSYSKPESLRREINQYLVDGRPVIVSEWLARTLGSNVKDCLPVLKEMNVGAVTWGFVAGKTGTIWPWRSRQDKQGRKLDPEQMRKDGKVVRPGEKFPEPAVWFHDLLRMDGTPYDPEEIEVFKKLTGKK